MEIIDNIEPGTDTHKLEYHGRGESVYADGRQVMVRACHDAIVGYRNKEGKKGGILIRRMAEPANGYLWCLGGFIDRGIPTEKSLARRIKSESGLEIDNPLLLTVERFMWGTTPNSLAKEKGLPLGIDDLGILFYCEGKGNLNLDKLHEEPLIVTPEMYTPLFRNQLHPYIQRGMDLSIPFLKK